MPVGVLATGMSAELAVVVKLPSTSITSTVSLGGPIPSVLGVSAEDKDGKALHLYLMHFPPQAISVMTVRMALKCLAEP